MERGEVLIRYGAFCKEIQSLGGFHLSSVPTVDELFKNKSLKQRAYREMKQCEFQGTVIDYLSWISSAYLIDIRRNFWDSDVDAIIGWLIDLVNNYDKYPVEIKNLIRVCDKNQSCLDFVVNRVIGDLSSETTTKKTLLRKMAMRGALSSLKIIILSKEAGVKGDYDDLASFLKQGLRIFNDKIFFS